MKLVAENRSLQSDLSVCSSRIIIRPNVASTPKPALQGDMDGLIREKEMLMREKSNLIRERDSLIR